MTQDIMHVGIEYPHQNRKDLLNVAVDAIQVLKEFELHKRVNKEKDVYRKNFIHVVKELSIAIHEFKEKVPYEEVAMKKEKKEPGKPVKEKPKKVAIKKIPKTHLDKLEDDIASLRSKIESL